MGVTFKTADGYTFHLLADGSVADHADPERADMTWPSLADFLQSMAEEGVSLRIIGNGFRFNAKPTT